MGQEIRISGRHIQNLSFSHIKTLHNFLSFFTLTVRWALCVSDYLFTPPNLGDLYMIPQRSCDAQQRFLLLLLLLMRCRCLHSMMWEVVVVMLMVWMMMVMMPPIRRVRQAGNTQRILRVPRIRPHRPMIRRRGPETRIAAEPIFRAAAAARRRRRRNRGGAAQAGDA